MKKFLLPALLFAAASLTGCASYNVSQPIAPVAGAVKTDLKADARRRADQRRLLGQYPVRLPQVRRRQPVRRRRHLRRRKRLGPEPRRLRPGVLGQGRRRVQGGEELQCRPDRGAALRGFGERLLPVQEGRRQGHRQQGHHPLHPLSSVSLSAAQAAEAGFHPVSATPPSPRRFQAVMLRHALGHDGPFYPSRATSGTIPRRHRPGERGC